MRKFLPQYGVKGHCRTLPTYNLLPQRCADIGFLYIPSLRLSTLPPPPRACCWRVALPGLLAEVAGGRSWCPVSPHQTSYGLGRARPSWGWHVVTYASMGRMLNILVAYASHGQCVYIMRLYLYVCVLFSFTANTLYVCRSVRCGTDLPDGCYLEFFF